MITVGIEGKPGSGKSTIASMLAEYDGVITIREGKKREAILTGQVEVENEVDVTFSITDINGNAVKDADDTETMFVPAAAINSPGYVKSVKIYPTSSPYVYV